MNQPTVECFVQRLDRLERDNRRMKRMGGLMLVGIAGLVLMGQSQCNTSKTGVNQPTKVVDAQEFIVRDAQGQPRARLTKTELIFTNAAGKERISGYFAPFRPVVSHHSGRLFRSIPATHFGAFRPPRVGVQSMS